MPIEIRITVNQGESLEVMMAELGFQRGIVPFTADEYADIEDEENPKAVTLTEGASYSSAPTVTIDGPVRTATVEPRRTRRTRAQIEAAKAAAAAGAQATAPISNISTGEERIDPAVAAQDKADEAAESKPGEITHLPIRDAIQRYTEKFGIAQGQEVVPQLLGGGIIDIPLTKEAIAAAVAKIDAATASADGRSGTFAPAQSETGLFGDSPQPAAAPAAPSVAPATADDVQKAAMDYALKYDGQNTDQTKMLNTLADIPQVLSKTLPGVQRFKEIPNDPMAYGKAVAAIRMAIDQNPFGRAAR